MQPDVVAAQADTLRDWASSWEREALVTQGSAAENVAAALLDCADLMLRAAGIAPARGETPPRLPEPPHALQVRDE